MLKKGYKYDAVLSFAGEDRNFVEKIAEGHKSRGIKIFYDKYNEVNLWGKDLYTHLDDIYQNKAEYCIIFISKWYANKNWTNHERISAQARAFVESEEYILPIRLDNTQIPGIRPTIGYIDGNKYTPKELVNIIAQKINRQEVKVVENDNISTDEILIPKVPRNISDLERKRFLKSSFEIIKNYFKDALRKLNKANTHVESDIDEITSSKFVATVYVEGKIKCQCKIWIGGMRGGENSISFAEGPRGLDINNDNSMNDSATVADDGVELFFSTLGLSFGYLEGVNKIDLKRASAKDVATYYWARFINYLKY